MNNWLCWFYIRNRDYIGKTGQEHGRDYLGSNVQGLGLRFQGFKA